MKILASIALLLVLVAIVDCRGFVRNEKTVNDNLDETLEFMLSMEAENRKEKKSNQNMQNATQSVKVGLSAFGTALPPTFQSSTVAGGDSSRAFDGNNASPWLSGSCTHTNLESNPWWAVDLGADYTISKVVITNRGDCCSERLHDFVVGVNDVSPELEAPSPFNYRVCALVPGVAGLTVTVTCAALGRYVIIQIPDTIDNILTLCEVEIFGTGSLPIKPTN